MTVLASIAVVNEHRGGYERGLFDYPDDANGDGCDTRDDILRRDSATPVVTGSNCRVISGTWVSPYDQITVLDPVGLEIDHVVALKEAWDSGAWNWPTDRRRAFANDLSDPAALRAVTTSSNQAKGDRDPSNWLPSDQGNVCAFIGEWVTIKAQWGLSMDQSEYGRIRNLLLGACTGLLLKQTSTPTTVSPTTVEQTTPTTPTITGQTAPPSAVYYANCTAARAAGVAPLHRGDPGYRSGLDRDGDGNACE